jgi:hypothetical protein
MQVDVSFVLDTVKLDFHSREVQVWGRVKVGKREMPLHKMRKFLHEEWKNLEDIGIRTLTEAVNEAEMKK